MSYEPGRQRPTVLVTNDDGYLASGLRALSAAIEARGLDVVVLAPERNHTAAGHGVSLRPLTIVERGLGIYSCDGTPADCVRVAVLCGLLPRPALVISGANHGANAGEDVTYSGTVAAAVEGARLGLPALAVSQDSDGPEQGFLALHPRDFPNIEYAAAVADHLAHYSTPGGTLLSLNLPSRPMVRSALVAQLGSRHWAAARGGLHVDRPGWFTADQWADPPKADLRGDTDIAVLSRGDAAMSLLSVHGGVSDVTEMHQRWIQDVVDAVPFES